ncbi:MBL fold metallo-hydrolase [candidate division KSB1 bacterium]
MYNWMGKNFSVKILYSKASIATGIIIKLNDTGKYILIDCGDGTLRDLLEAGIETDKISAIFLSHEHYDHIGGIYSLFGYFRFKKRTDDIQIYYPANCRTIKKIFTILFENYKKDSFSINLNPVNIGNVLIHDNIKEAKELGKFAKDYIFIHKK